MNQGISKNSIKWRKSNARQSFPSSFQTAKSQVCRNPSSSNPSSLVRLRSFQVLSSDAFMHFQVRKSLRQVPSSSESSFNSFKFFQVLSSDSSRFESSFRFFRVILQGVFILQACEVLSKTISKSVPSPSFFATTLSLALLIEWRSTSTSFFCLSWLFTLFTTPDH